MTNEPPVISVVIPNYNGKGLLESNLPSLFEALRGIQSEVIVVDDASTDDSLIFLTQNFPAVLQIRNPTNRGFSITCNRGIDAARGRLTCVSNSDVVFSENYFRLAISAMDEEKLFAVKGPIVNFRKSLTNITNVDTTAILFSQRGFLRFNKTEDNRPGLMSGKMGERFTLLGCCFVADTSSLKALGGFDPIFSPFYWEDSDLPLRALRIGHLIRYLPEAIVFHEQGSTIDQSRSRYWRKLVSDRNKFLFSWRYINERHLWVKHFLYVTCSIPIRWIRLDFGYYFALIWALITVTVGNQRTRLRP